MQRIDLTAFGAAKANDRKTLALLAYDSAKADPATANWEAVADMLRACFPVSRKVKGDGMPEWWRFDKTGRKVTFPVIEVRLADGEVIRANAATDPGKPLNIGRGLRTAIAFYRARIAHKVGPVCLANRATHRPDGTALPASDFHVAVPEFSTVVCLTTGESFDAGVCSHLTAEWRAGSWCYADAWAEAEHVATLPARQADALFPEMPFGAGEPRDVVRALYRRAWIAAADPARALADMALAQRIRDVTAELERRREVCRLYLWLAGREYERKPLARRNALLAVVREWRPAIRAARRELGTLQAARPVAPACVDVAADTRKPAPAPETSSVVPITSRTRMRVRVPAGLLSGVSVLTFQARA